MIIYITIYDIYMVFTYDYTCDIYGYTKMILYLIIFDIYMIDI